MKYFFAPEEGAIAPSNMRSTRQTTVFLWSLLFVSFGSENRTLAGFESVHYAWKAHGRIICIVSIK